MAPREHWLMLMVPIRIPTCTSLCRKLKASTKKRTKMTRQIPTDTYIKVCMKTWLLCESCAHSESTSDTPRYDLVLECTTTAKTCFAVVSKPVSNADDMG